MFVYTGSVGHHIVSVMCIHYRVKRQTADQRIAELQALIALAQLQLVQVEQHRPIYGHGYVDPHNS